MRLAGLLIAAAVAAQSLAPSGAVLVCKYTGKVLDPCACPEQAHQVPDAPTLQAQSCCEWRAAPPAVPALARAAAPSPSRLEALDRVALSPSLPAEPERPCAEITARPQAPPGTPLYLAIRTLLI